MRGRTFLAFCLFLALSLCPSALAVERLAYDLDRMRQMNPDFTTYPNEKGIVWLKQDTVARKEGVGIERMHLWVILGRQGLKEKWLTWNIQDPEGGIAEITEASVYSPATGKIIRSVTPSSEGGLHTVAFTGLPETFILVLSWREILSGQLNLEGVYCFPTREREGLRVWESVVEVRTSSPRDLEYRVFPVDIRPETVEPLSPGGETTLTWRRINVEPPSRGLVQNSQSGVAFTQYHGEARLNQLIRGLDAEDSPAPSMKARDNRLSAVMDLKLNEQGILSGPVRVMLRGAWGPFFLSGSAPDKAALEEVVAALFPDLKNYGEVKHRSVKGIPELSFVLEGKPGVAGSGQGILALPPAFVPAAFRSLEDMTPPFDLSFPFVLEQTMNISLPKGSSRALVSGEVKRSSDKVNYSENYKTKKGKLTAEARFEAGVRNIANDNAGLFQRNMGLWRSFSSKPIPVM
ncbi:MAG: hypothetical protein K6E38_01505 [Fretibacterium sp.]|nr:hypothetical protein [Fretibacterium sp.]